ncbi:putative dehydrogenase [Caldalkalibacillus uzonensis]|uniref:Dehydrogenase n=1 Tax=Caldalkalibacillus uzonensis TaxID=353224 RepID=A0ABU0CR18_9BACI|nr:Gfo/Idh/MocA family oxidoreductase [Caldalkalibacillus uzonensis]MDQ0338819.1 putative dehydrogenase [Caldalkalibacillus uzonensis]
MGVNQTLNVGMIGYKFMGKAHSHAYRDVSFYFNPSLKPVLKTIVGRNEVGVKQAAAQFGFEAAHTDWRELIKSDEIDLIDIVTPNNTHAEMVIEAAQAGKHILCEKPLAMNVQEGKEMLKAVQEAGVVHMISHNYRFAPAVQLAKKLIEEGKLGRIYHIRAQYLQDWIMDPDFPLVWRLRKDVTGSGALGDIGSHIIDLARFLVGEIEQVTGMTEIFIKERPMGEMTEGLHAAQSSVQKGKVDVDDAVAFLARFNNGALGVFEATRFAAGNRNKNKFEINGSKGSIRWDLENMNLLEVYFTDDDKSLQGFRTINVTESVHPYVNQYWPAGHIIGYEHTFINLVYELIQGIAEGKQVSPSFEDGVRNQAVLEAIARSAREGAWINVSELL